MIYRGQLYGENVGEWWTTSVREAENFAIPRGRSWVVLAIDEDDWAWLTQFETTYQHTFEGEPHTWYRIPIARLRERWHAVRIHNGSINLAQTTIGTDVQSVP